MILDLTITIQPNEEGKKNLIEKKLHATLSEVLKQSKIEIPAQDFDFKFVKKSIDARHGRQKFILRYKAFTENERNELERKIVWKKADTSHGAKKVLIVGSGPAGLFAALRFLENGIQPVIIERGKITSERKRDIAQISTRGIVDGDSNYCFGEGGAGTFSDGKLFTRSTKRGDVEKILRIFCEFGADEKILTDSHAHIGTDRLPKIVNAMREKIISLGGDFYFGMRCVDFLVENFSGRKIVKGIRAVQVDSNEEKEFFGDAVLLATGHSACDIYEQIAKISGESLEAKTFALGVRVEHPRTIIDKIQFHGKSDSNLGAAEYRLTSQVEGRGVYTFCMCPGGFVVPSATESEQIVLNGMSCAKRNSPWSNSAIVVETRPEDIPQKFFEQAEESGAAALAPLYFRRWIEHETFLHGSPPCQKAPAQLLKDFLRGKASRDFPKVSYTPGIVSSRLDKWLPVQIASHLKEGIKEFDKKMRGFICDEAVLLASETRTSTPVRILRNRKTFECAGLSRLYPCGEGSGYSGGIVSSAMDGENAAQAALRKLAAE